MLVSAGRRNLLLYRGFVEMLVTFPLWLIATTCQSYPVNPGDTGLADVAGPGLADVAEPHAARASEVRKMHALASARNRARCLMGIVCLRRAALSRGLTACLLAVVTAGWAVLPAREEGCLMLPPPPAASDTVMAFTAGLTIPPVLPG
jgi:hypothetical protein